METVSTINWSILQRNFWGEVWANYTKGSRSIVDGKTTEFQLFVFMGYQILTRGLDKTDGTQRVVPALTYEV